MITRAPAHAAGEDLLGAEKGTLRPRFDTTAMALVAADDAAPPPPARPSRMRFPTSTSPRSRAACATTPWWELGQRSFFHPMTIRFPAPAQPPYPNAPADDPQRLQCLLARLAPR